MTIEQTSQVKELPWSGAEHGVPGAAAPPARAKPARKLPVQKDWPSWIIPGVQLGILVGIVALWEAGATTGFVDAFFWSHPSAIFKTLQIFFTTGDAWTDIGFTFRSTIIGFLIGTIAGSALGLSFWWSRTCCAVVQPSTIGLQL